MRASVASDEGVAGPSEAGVPLNPHHTHFLIVDDGSNVPSWASEQTLAVEFEAALARQLNVPICQLLVQGDQQALRRSCATAWTRTPIICIAESGGAASAVYHYFRGGERLVDEHAPSFLMENRTVCACRAEPFLSVSLLPQAAVRTVTFPRFC
eukprot:4409245-Prymnesium_polylepis.1